MLEEEKVEKNGEESWDGCSVNQPFRSWRGAGVVVRSAKRGKPSAAISCLFVALIRAKVGGFG
jgi:hypothetical protein